MRKMKAPLGVGGMLCVAVLLTACGGATSGSGGKQLAEASKPLQLQGETSFIQSGLVEVTAGRSVWKGDVSNGKFAIDVSPDDDQVVLVKALGVGHQARVIYASVLGTGAALRARAGDSRLDPSESAALKLGALSTAKFGQLPVSELNAGNVDAALASVDSLEAYQVATAIQLVSREASLTLPKGLSDTLALANSALLRAGYARSLSGNANYRSAAAELDAGRVKPAITEAALIGTVSLLTGAGNSSGVAVNFRSGGSADIYYGDQGYQASSTSTDSGGNYTGSYGFVTSKDSAHWSINATDGSVHLVPDHGIHYDRADFAFGTPCAPDPSNDFGVNCLTRYTLKALDFQLISGAFGRHLGMVTTVTEASYPTVPGAAPVTQEFADFEAITLPSGYYKFSSAELAGRSMMLPVFSSAGASTLTSPGSPLPPINVDLVTLNADGTGTVPRLGGVTLNWSLADGGKSLAVEYSNGHRASYRKAAREKPQPYSFNGSEFSGTALNDLRDLFDILGFGAQEFRLISVQSQPADALEFASRTVFEPFNSTASFTDAEVPGRYNQFGVGAEDSDPYGDFVIDLFPDHTGSQITLYYCPPEDPFYADNGCTYPGEFLPFASSFKVFWSVNASGQLVLERRRFFNSSNRPVSGSAGRNCAPVGATDASGNVCKAVDIRTLTIVRQHGNRLVVQEARKINGSLAVPVEGYQPYYLGRFYDRSPLDN